MTRVQRGYRCGTRSETRDSTALETPSDPRRHASSRSHCNASTIILLLFFRGVTGGVGVNVSPTRSSAVHCSTPIVQASVGRSLSGSTSCWPFARGALVREREGTAVFGERVESLECVGRAGGTHGPGAGHRGVCS
jgi:hypothetical protein